MENGGSGQPTDSSALSAPTRRPGGRRRPRAGGPSKKSLWNAAHRRRRGSPIEGRLAGILHDLHLRFVREYWIGHFWVDFALEDFYLVIEADGRLYHGDTKREDNRDEELKRRGWDVLHVFGPNIINERMHVIESIKRAVRTARPRPLKPGEPPRQDVIAGWDLPKPRPTPGNGRRRYRHHSVLDKPA
jgi:very-short-patch-repair endonuclease